MLFRAVVIGTKAARNGSRSISRGKRHLDIVTDPLNIALFQKRKHSSTKPDPSDPLSRDTYKGLALHGYNALSELRWSEVDMPLELNDDQLLVKVEAASINALDVDMLNGYGQQLFESVRPLPAVLGRDFSGTVVAKGSGVWNYKLGDHVIGAPVPYAQGTFGEYCVVSEFQVAPKPKNLTHVEAASLPYAALTAMNALHDAKLLQGPASGPIAVLGATGGVGTTALQLLLALTPSTQSSPIIAVARPGSPHTARLEQLLQGRARVVAGGPELAFTTAGGPFAAIVDLAGVIETQWLPMLKEGGSFSTVRGNLIKTAQEYSHFTVGLGIGFANYLSHKYKVQQDHNINYAWSYFWPSSDKLETISKLAEESKIKPVVDKVFEAVDYLQAFEYLENGSHFGKVVLSLENLPRGE